MVETRIIVDAMRMGRSGGPAMGQRGRQSCTLWGQGAPKRRGLKQFHLGTTKPNAVRWNSPGDTTPRPALETSTGRRHSAPSQISAITLSTRRAHHQRPGAEEFRQFLRGRV